MAKPRAIAQPKSFPAGSFEWLASQLLKNFEMSEGIFRPGATVSQLRAGVHTNIKIVDGHLIMEVRRLVPGGSTIDSTYTFVILECGKISEIISLRLGHVMGDRVEVIQDVKQGSLF